MNNKTAQQELEELTEKIVLVQAEIDAIDEELAYAREHGHTSTHELPEDLLRKERELYKRMALARPAEGVELRLEVTRLGQEIRDYYPMPPARRRLLMFGREKFEKVRDKLITARQGRVDHIAWEERVAYAERRNIST